MIDIETGQIVDMIYTRDGLEVTEWLKTYPNISVVSRDGSRMYAKAISTSHPNALQVSDRFHLVKGLTDAARLYITGIIASRIRIESDKAKEDCDYWGNTPRYETDLPERLHNASIEKREAKIRMARELAAQGIDIRQIAQELGVHPTTAKKYLDENFNLRNKQYGENRPSKLKFYAETIDEMLTKQKTFREIEEQIREIGYRGAASTIRMYATRKRKLNQAAYGKSVVNTDVVERKWLLKLLYHPLEKVKGITESQLEKIIAEYPVLDEVYHTVRAFKELVFAKRPNDLDVWIESAKTLNSDDINSFLNGISRDIIAVKNAIQYDYNNGIAEGNINKIKLIKRIMFGRCSFDTLRRKTLMLEQCKFVN